MDDNELYIKLCAEDEAAFTMFYKQTYPMVHAYVIQNNGGQDDAMDCMQDAIINLIRNLRENKFRGDSKLTSYFFSIAKNVWLDQLRKKSRKLNNGSTDIEDIPDKLLINQDLSSQSEEEQQILDQLERVMNKLEGACKELLMKSFYEKKHLNEIALEMGYTQNFVKIKKGRCLDGLRKLFKGIL